MPRWPHGPARCGGSPAKYLMARPSPTARIDTANEPRELAWTSLLSLDDDDAADAGVEVQWWFRLAPNWTGTEVEHGVRVPRDVSKPRRSSAFVVAWSRGSRA